MVVFSKRQLVFLYGSNSLPDDVFFLDTELIKATGNSLKSNTDHSLFLSDRKGNKQLISSSCVAAIGT
jgi:hypothetical protein